MFFRQKTKQKDVELGTEQFNIPKQVLDKSTTSIDLVRRVQILILLSWFLFLIYGEKVVFFHSVYQCSDKNEPENIHQVLIVSDPQLTGAYSYSHLGKFLSLVEYYSDIYMRRYYQAYLDTYNIKSVIFLGDLFDGVTNSLFFEFSRTTWTSAEYEHMNKRWKWVFPESNGTKQYFVSGNHDIGWRLPYGQKELIEVYRRNFGELNYKFELNGVEFIVIASTAASDGSSITSLVEETQNFIKSVAATTKTKPRVLLTHIPLWRDRNAGCGSVGEGYVLTYSTGFSYETLLSPKTTNHIISSIQPDIILSGDIHHVCYYLREGKIHDYVMNTFGWMQGNKYPGAAILNINKDVDISVDICWHHNQIKLYTIYAIKAMVTVFISIWISIKYKISRSRFILMTIAPILMWYLIIQFLSS
eukprot:TRINITY_DN3169_c0_g1_i3.p1 TRINITY_DN3169_c0_g1~~TRINITY_DN3169_c0_g1_i3.p1  ORF type:complete len:416 (-),score=18.83 TRINITY_DN3169_c0_g1_i3:106-1353(-)